MNTANRIRAIERAMGNDADRCSDCGWPLPATAPIPRELFRERIKSGEVTFRKMRFREQGEPPAPPMPPCPTCGRDVGATFHPVTFDGDKTIKGSA